MAGHNINHSLYYFKINKLKHHQAQKACDKMSQNTTLQPQRVTKLAQSFQSVVLDNSQNPHKKAATLNLQKH